MRHKVKDLSFFISALYQSEQISVEHKTLLTQGLSKGLKTGSFTEFESSARFINFGVKSPLLDDLLELIKEDNNEN